MRRKICVYTSNRSEYSRLKSVLENIKKRDDMELYLVVTGCHLLERYGKSINDIEKDGFKVHEKIYTVIEGENPITMSKSTGLSIIEMTTYLNNLRPDFLLIVGDRYDLIPAVIAASYMNIPIAHIQGGEMTGSIDEVIRHAVTKFAHLHFPSTERSREIIIRMGEDPKRVFRVGCPSIDLLLRINPGTQRELFNTPSIVPKVRRKLKPDQPFLLVIQHPVTTEYEQSYHQIEETLFALHEIKIQTIMIYPNLDAGSDLIVTAIRRFCARNEPEYLFLYKHFEFETFARLLYHTSCIVGNSSAGIRESCYWGTPSVNIGTRQNNRERGKNVIQVGYNRHEIKEAILHQLRTGRYPRENIYGDGKAGERIVDILSSYKVKIQKQLYTKTV
jgi:UDP-hydrolysing UDP-N-acetyl-D-glucosamine 2-epimerase